MPFTSPHAWKVTPKQATEIQEKLRNQVIHQDRFTEIRRVAGIDVSIESGGGISHTAVVILRYPGLDLIESTVASLPTQFPYIPGLLSFREIPVILEALNQITELPDLLMCDGHGLAHPRRFGLASHLGLLCDLPCIGVAKSRLVGEHAAVGREGGDWQPLTDKGEIIGAAVRTRKDTKPVFVSIGHRVCLETAIKLVISCTTRYRLPETTRQAHQLASNRRKEAIIGKI